MTTNLIVTLIFGSLAALMSVSAIVIVVRSTLFRCKPIWIVGSLVGFIGLGASNDLDGHLYILTGLVVPVMLISKVGVGGAWIVKTGFPFVATVVLGKRFPIPR